jgi:hypothetical protein
MQEEEEEEEKEIGGRGSLYRFCPHVCPFVFILDYVIL